MMRFTCAAWVATGLVVAAMLGLGPAAAAAPHDPAVEAPIIQFVDAFNKGDAARAKDAMMSTGAVIIDEVPPFRWAGPKAFENWAADDARDIALNGIAAQKVVISAPTREMVSGTHAYVIVPAVYTFTQKGVAMSETAQMTFVLDKGTAGWKIVSWTWTGPDPSAVRAAP